MPASTNTVLPSIYGPVYQTTGDKADIVLDAAAAAGHRVIRIYGYNSTPDHNNLKCVDFMGTDGKSPVDHAMMNWVADYCKRNADILGVAGIIWNRRVMGFPENDGAYYRGPRGQWRTYTGPNPHVDHVHVQFDRSPIKGKTSTPATPSAPAASAKNDVAMYCKDSGIKGYNAAGGVKHIRPKGYKIVGHWVTRMDGKYLRTAWNTDYPADDLAATKPATTKAQDAVSLTALRAAAAKDPKRPQGGVSPDAVDDVRMVEAALQAEGLLDRKYAHDGSFGSTTIAAYAAWQRRLGYSGKDANGIPGMASLKKLGDKYDFATTNHD